MRDVNSKISLIILIEEYIKEISEKTLPY